MAVPRYVGMLLPNGHHQQQQQQHDFNMQYQAPNPQQLYQNSSMAPVGNYHPHLLQQQQYAQLQFANGNHTLSHMQNPNQAQFYQHQHTAPVFHSNAGPVPPHQIQQQQSRSTEHGQDQNARPSHLLDSKAGPSSAVHQQKWALMDADSSRMSAETDWMEEEDSMDGAGSANGGNMDRERDNFSCTHCDKTYKGKHARSIWRRHLQDKHGIPLSHQPRRTRWDADVNRPKNAEERRERMLESKRRWARKKRAMDKSEGKVKSEEDAMTPESGTSTPAADAGVAAKKEAGAKPGRKDKKVNASSVPPADNPAGVSASMPAPALANGSATGDAGVKRPNLVAPAAGETSSAHIPWSFGRQSQLAATSTVPFTSALGSAFPTANTLPSPTGTPDRRRGGRHNASLSVQFSPTAMVPSSSSSQIPLTTPSRLTSASHGHSMSRSISMGSVGMNPNPFSLEHHKISPIAPARPLASARKARGSISSHGRVLSLAQPDLAMSPTRPPSTSRHSSLRGGFPSLLDTPNKHAMDDGLLLGQNASESRFSLRTGAKGGDEGSGELGESAMKDEPRAVKLGSTILGHRRKSSRLSALRGSSDDEGKLPSAALTSLDNDRPRRSRKPTSGESGFDDSGLCLTGMTPFHKSIGRQLNGIGGMGGTPASHGLLDSFPQTVGRPTPFKRGHRQGNHSSADSLDLDNFPQPRDAFSSPHHPNLAHSLGLAPQSALRTGSTSGGGATGASAFDFGGLGASPFQHSSMMGMSLGFTPWEKGSGALGRRDSVGISWPESIRKPLTGALRFEAGHRRSSSVPPLDQDDEAGDDEDEGPTSTVKGSPRGKENVNSSASKGGRYHPSLVETPSRPSGKSRRGGSGIKRKHGADEDDDDDEGTLYPLRFSMAGNKKQNTGTRAATVDAL